MLCWWRPRQTAAWPGITVVLSGAHSARHHHQHTGVGGGGRQGWGHQQCLNNTNHHLTLTGAPYTITYTIHSVGPLINSVQHQCQWPGGRGPEVGWRWRPEKAGSGPIVVPAPPAVRHRSHNGYYDYLLGLHHQR